MAAEFFSSSAAGPRVSVVVPSYNYGHFVGAAIQSVRAQSFGDWELIVIDDGSTDDTRGVVGAIDDPRVTYVHQENAGLSAARNAGLRLARGAFVAFLDADDLWHPDYLRTAVAKLDELDPAWGLVASETSRIGPEGEALPLPRHHAAFRFAGELTARRFCLRNRPFPSAVLARRAVYTECGGFDVTLRSSEDRDMWIRATSAHWRFWFLDEPLVRIRRHAQNMSKNAVRMKQNTRATLLRAYRRGAVSRLDLPFWCRAFSIHFFQIAWTHFDEGRRWAAFRYLAASVLLCPVFLSPAAFSEPPLFRGRALAHFLWRSLRGGLSPAPERAEDKPAALAG